MFLTITPVSSMLMGLGLLSTPSMVFAQDSITATLPNNAEHNADATADIIATLSGAESSGLGTSSFVIHASQTDIDNPLANNTTSGSGTTQISVNPFSDFHPGELVQATVTAGVMTAGGALSPHVWQFRTRAQSGTGTFSQSSDVLGNNVSGGG